MVKDVTATAKTLDDLLMSTVGKILISIVAILLTALLVAAFSVYYFPRATFDAVENTEST